MSQLLRSRLAAQGLADRPARDPAGVAERLLAVQGQDPRGFRLAVRARSQGLAAADVDRALSEERSLVVTWLNRGTLHLVRSEDYPWLHALTTPPQLTGTLRRLRQLGVGEAAAERGVAAVRRALVEEGPLSRAELEPHVRRARVKTEGQALLHVLGLAALQGVSVRGPVRGRQHPYVLVEDWLGPQPPVDRDRALGELARRYLVGHGPADERDLAKWAGLPLRDVRAGLGAIASEVVERRDGLLELKGTPKPARLPSPQLLGAFDPVLLGWADREFLVGSDPGRIISGGMFLPFALVRGRVAGRWRLADSRVQLDLFEDVGARPAAQLRAEAADVERFFAA